MRRVVVAVALLIVCASALSAAEPVKIGVYVMRLNDLNPAQESFSTDVWIWTLSNAAAPLHPIQSLRLQDTKSVSPDTPGEVAENGILWGYRELAATIMKHWDTRHYPFDHHTLVIEIAETLHDADALVYVPDTANSKIDPRVTVPGWKITGARLETHTVNYATRFGDPRPGTSNTRWAEAWLLIDVRRNGFGIFVKVVMVAYIAFALMMLSFAMDASAFSSRISLLIGSLFATVVNMRASESVLGRTDTFGLTDQIHLLVAFFIFVSAATALITKGMEAKRARRIDRWTAAASFATFVLANAVLIGSGFIG
jgi:hypothetical protein